MTDAHRRVKLYALNADKSKIRKYPCGYPGCQWVFTRTNHVVRHHERVHPGFRPNKSSSHEAEKGAAAKPATKAETESHSSKCEAPSIFHACYVTGCKQQFNTKNELNIHLFHVHSVVEPEVCIKVEGQEWNDEENTTLMTNKMLNRRYVCDFVGCDKAYTKNSHLIRHKEDSHNVIRPPCPIKYMRSPRPYACTLPGCDKTYTKNSHLIRHLVETHKMTKPAPKVNRGLIPNFGSHLANALLQISSSSSSSSSSSTSPSVVTSPSAVTSTSTSSTTPNRIGDAPMIYNDRPYACTFPGCGWSFKRQYHLNRHIITHRMNNRKDGNRSHNNNTINQNNKNNVCNIINNASSSNDNLNNSINNNTELSALITAARNLSVARPKLESISWIVLEDGDDEDGQESADEQPTLPRRHISIEEDTFCCDFPGCGRMFVNSRDLMVHYLGHSGPSGLLLGGSHLIRSSHSDLTDMLEEPPLECVLEEFGDDDENDINGEDDLDKGINELPINGSKSRDCKITTTASD
ncbi:peroxisomal membrane protein PEX14 [Tetranychus urticae]|uniref:C2H2-type domain-containing protein n=1 Tax=Tetranychus urticae TaxID=32264 RepID=T1KA18_TETUR|nr:peroxisomal membrane protein PEX14 [Tetranychus urticae]